MGLFAKWQAEYSRHGIATFPVRIEGKDKRPAVKGYLRVGKNASRQFAEKFGESDAFGFALKPSRITVLDVDTPDERVLADAMARHGRSPLIVRSVSGNYQAWYRHNGEKRLVRPWRDVPIDVLGHGYVVAPPSRSDRGAYQIIEGSLDDLDRLPRLQNLSLSSNDSDAELSAIQTQMPTERIGEGKRNRALFDFCMRTALECGDHAELLELARLYADQTFTPNLPGAEIVQTAESAWRYTEQGKNRYGGRRIEIDHKVIDGLMMAHPDAYILLTLLRRHHWARDFVVANGMAPTMPGGGWPVKRLAAARKVLEEGGYIKKIRGHSSKAGPALYCWP